MNKQFVYDEVTKLEQVCYDSCQYLWDNPEVAGTEDKSCSYMMKLMEDNGFRISTNDKVERAFVAEYGSGKPVLAILGEYDALANLSQKVSAVKEPVEGVPDVGHGCGHNLLGSAAATAAIALKHYLDESGVSGTIRFYGCPEEELLCGKVKMIYHGMFDGCDLAMSWHPNDYSIVYDKAYLASASAHFEFTGRTAHAAFAPELGRSALDAAELMSVGVQFLREHVTSNARIHYSYDTGNYPPNIVPDWTGMWYFARSANIVEVKDIMERLGKCAQGAAMMTETESSMKIDYGCCEYMGLSTFTDLTQKNLEEAPFPEYTDEEIAFARDIQASLKPENLAASRVAYDAPDEVMATKIADRYRGKIKPLNASSDSGDVSHMMPMNLFETQTFPVGVAPHTWQATACTGHSIGRKGALQAAYVIAGTGYDLLNQPETVEAIKAEFAEKADPYKPMYEG